MESLGRNRELEALGYYGKQVYWIRCVDCVEGGRLAQDEDSDADTEPEMLRDADNKGQKEDESGDGEEEDEEGGGEMEGEQGRWKDEDEDEEDEEEDDEDEDYDAKPARKTPKNTEKKPEKKPARKQKKSVKKPESESDSSASESESESESDSEEEEPVSFAVALTLLQDHPAANDSFLRPRCVNWQQMAVIKSVFRFEQTGCSQGAGVMYSKSVHIFALYMEEDTEQDQYVIWTGRPGGVSGYPRAWCRSTS